MTRSELFTFIEKLDKIKNLKGVKFNYIIDKNKKLIQQEIEDIKKVIEPTEKFKEYENKRVEILTEFADKNPDGSPKLTQEANGIIKFEIDPDNKKFQKAINAHIEEYKEVIQDRDKQMFEYNNFLAETADISLFKFKLTDIPEDIIGEQFEVISIFIEE